MPEWSIGHAWKACVPQGTEGSNPSPSVQNPQILPRRRPSSSMSRRFLQRKEPDRPAITYSVIPISRTSTRRNAQFRSFGLKRLAMNRDEETALLRPGETKYVADHEVATMFVVLNSFSRRSSALFGFVRQPGGCSAG